MCPAVTEVRVGRLQIGAVELVDPWGRVGLVEAPEEFDQDGAVNPPVRVNVRTPDFFASAGAVVRGSSGVIVE